MAFSGRQAASSFPVKAYLLGFALAVALPIIGFAGFLLVYYSAAEQANFERSAARSARQITRLLDGEMLALVKGLRGLAASSNLTAGNVAEFYREASRYAGDSGQLIVLRDYEGRQLFNTSRPFGAALPPAIALKQHEEAALKAGRYVVSDVFFSPISGEPRVAVAIPVRPGGADMILATTLPTVALREAILTAMTPGWIIGVGDRAGSYVTRSERHEDVSGKPTSPEYYKKAVGKSGSFVSLSLDGTEVVAGYYWSDVSGWLIAANVPRTTVEAPLWRSLAWLGAFGAMSAVLSLGLAALLGRRFSKAARDLVERALAFGAGQQFLQMSTGIREFDLIAQAFAAADERLRKRGTELEAVLSTVPAAVWFTYDPRAAIVVRNRFAAEFMRLPISETAAFTEGPRVPGTVRMQKKGRDLDVHEFPLQRALAGEEVVDDEYIFAYADGTSRVVLISAKPITDSAGRRIGAVAVGLDVTERKRGEEQRRLLVNELNHRVKNTLASVQSVAVQTLRNSSSLEAAAESLQSRLIALSRAHDVLNRESWEGAELADMVAASLKAYTASSRIGWRGPPVWLPPTTALSFTLVLHELATNAAKYGALSNDSGTINIQWRIGEERQDYALLTVIWTERGGPPVAQPLREGFGSRLVSRLVSAEKEGTVSFDYRPEGLTCTIRVLINTRRDPVGAEDMEVAS